MQTTDYSYPMWITRIFGAGGDTQRMEEIVARYSHLVYSADPILKHLSLDELACIGNILASLPSSKEVFLAPYSFADLHLSDTPALQSLFDKLPFPLQCKTLDTARLYREADPPYAMIALDWESGTAQLLALSARQDELVTLSLAFLTDPLTKTMVDERHEKAKAYLLSRSKALLLEGTREKRIGIYEVTCSDELFVNKVFGPILDCPFSLVMGEKKDRWGRAIPSHISETDEERLLRSPRT